MKRNYHDTRGIFYGISARFDEFYGTLQIIVASKSNKKIVKYFVTRARKKLIEIL